MADTSLTLKRDVEPLVEEVATLNIISPATMEVATELLSRLNKLGDRIEAEKEKTMRPALDTVAAIRAQWAPFEKPVAANVLALRTKITKFQTDAVRKESEEKEAIIARIGDGKGKFKPQTAIDKLDAIAAPEKKVATASGSISFREEPRFRVADLTQIPYEYLLPDEKAIKTAQKAGTAIPGIEYYTEQVPINRR